MLTSIPQDYDSTTDGGVACANVIDDQTTHVTHAYQENAATREESGCLEALKQLRHGAVKAAEKIETEVIQIMHWITHVNGPQLWNVFGDLVMAIHEILQDDML